MRGGAGEGLRAGLRSSGKDSRAVRRGAGTLGPCRRGDRDSFHLDGAAPEPGTHAAIRFSVGRPLRKTRRSTRLDFIAATDARAPPTDGTQEEISMRWKEGCAVRRLPPPRSPSVHGPCSKPARQSGARLVLVATVACIPACAYAVAYSGPLDDLGGVTPGGDDGGVSDIATRSEWSYGPVYEASGGYDSGGVYGGEGGADREGPAESGSALDSGNGNQGTGDARGVACGAQSCSGCCDLSGNCVSGTLDNACGMGTACQDCTLVGQPCRAGACTSGGSSDASTPDARASACNLLSCLLGCCQGGTCMPGNVNSACGILGGACSDCQAAGRVCSGGSCSRGPSDGGSRGRLIRSPSGRVRGR
jgi:hypothetical protein